MTSSGLAVTNIETMAHNVSVYASYFDRANDTFNEVDDAVEEAEKSLLKLACIMRRYSTIL